MTTLDTRVPTACSCEACKNMCHRPCWPTPAEAHALMDAGFAARLMADYWSAADHDIRILCGALKGCEGHAAPYLPESEEGCTFWNAQGLCDLHDLGLKPLEGRLAIHGAPTTRRSLHEEVALLWDNEEGRAAVDRWWQARNEEEPE